MGFIGGLADGFTGAVSGTWEGLKSLAKGGYALATDQAARNQAWEATQSAAQTVGNYAGAVLDDPAKMIRDARDGVLAAYTAAENFVTTADAGDWGKLAGGGVFEVGTALISVGVAAKAGKLSRFAKVGKGVGKIEDIADAVTDATDAAKKLDKAAPECVQKCFLKKIPPKSWGKFSSRHNDEFMIALEEFRGTSDLALTPGLRGGEGQLFTSPKAPDVALKRWYENRVNDMDLSIRKLEDVRDAVDNNPNLVNDVDVVRIYERGSDWVKRDFDPDSVPLKNALADPDVVEAKTRVMKELERSQDESLRSLAKKLSRDPPSANLHWSPAKNKILVIDMM